MQNYTPNSRIIEEVVTKPLPSINQTHICLPFKPSMLLLTKTIHMAAPVKNSLLKLSIVFTILHAYIYSCPVSFMIALNAKQKNTCLLNVTVTNIHDLKV